MDLIANLSMGFGVAFTPINLLYAFIGCMLGTLIGVLPGIGPVATIAMLLPATYSLPPESALIMLAGIFYGAQYGGSTTAILVNMPGETSSVVTCIDGHQMARKGRAGAALAVAALGSFFAGCFSTLLIALAAALLVLAWHSEVRLAFFAVPLVAACGFACLALWWSARTTRDDWLSEVGRRSYSIYILHFFAVQLLEPALRRSVVAGLSTDLTILVCFVIGSGLAYFMAGMTHRWIELPGIALGKRVIERLRER